MPDSLPALEQQRSSLAQKNSGTFVPAPSRVPVAVVETRHAIVTSRTIPATRPTFVLPTSATARR
jgi:hypothetical protein